MSVRRHCLSFASNSTAQPKSQDSHHPSPAWYCTIATPKNATIRAVEQALEFVDAVCATGLASGRTNRCTAAQLRCASQDRDDGRNIVHMGASPGTGGGQQFDGIPARHRPGRLRPACRAGRSRSGLADGRSLQVLRRPVLSPLRPDAGCLARRAMGAMVRRRHHQYRSELHRQAPRHAGVGSDLSGLGGRRRPRAAPADLSRTRPRGRTPRAGVAQARHRPRRRGRDLHAEPAGNLCRVFRDPRSLAPSRCRCSRALAQARFSRG